MKQFDVHCVLGTIITYTAQKQTFPS